MLWFVLFCVPYFLKNQKAYKLYVCSLQVQSFSNDEHSPEPVDLLRFSPLRTNRYSIQYAPKSYSSITSRKSWEQLNVFTLFHFFHISKHCIDH